MLFWVIAALFTLLVLLVVFAPMIRGAGVAERRAAYDVQVYRDQLREIDRDVARGVIGEAEAEGSRLEISRKLLAAADEEAREAASMRAPRRATGLGGALAAAAAVGMAGWLYLGQGAPGYPDQPLAERLARQAEARANRPRQAEVEAIVAEQAEADAAGETTARNEGEELVDQLVAFLDDPPQAVGPDRLLEGYRLLVSSLGSLGRLAEAHRAQGRVVELLGGAADADEYVAWAELMIAAANGYVSPEAERALAQALDRDPMHPLARYYSGLTLLQGGRPDLAHRLWAGLLDEGPPDAPWVRAIAAEIDEVAMLAGLPPRGAEPRGPATTMDAPPLVEDAGERAMIDGMVASLGARLAEEGGPAEDWARLIRSLGVLGRIGEAAAIWDEAQERFAGDATAMALLTEAARDARLMQ